MSLRPPSRVKFALPVLALTALVCMPLALGELPSRVRAQGGASLALDADASNGSGACSPIDSNVEVEQGDEILVAICLTNAGEVPLAGYQFGITYDDRVIAAPEVSDDGAGLDDNPDANAGSTTFSSPALGDGWDCSAGVGAYPEGDDDGEQNGTGLAFSGGCASVPPGGKSFTQGPLAVIRFNAQGGGETRLTPTNVQITDDSLFEVGSCAPGIDAPMDCEGATITVSGAPVPGVTPGAVITPGTPSIGGTAVPGEQETAVAEDTAVALGTASAGGSTDTRTPAASGTVGAATPRGEDDGSSTPSRPGTPGTGTTGPDSGDSDGDNGGGATMWIVIGALAAAVTVAGGGAAYWYRMRQR
jgi:hypothetical protein